MSQVSLLNRATNICCFLGCIFEAYAFFALFLQGIKIFLNFAPQIMFTMKKVNIAIFASGEGTNCENIIRFFNDSTEVSTALVVTNKAESPVIEKAKKLGVPVQIVSKAELNDETVIKPLLEQLHHH